jgi:hypothetical protein
MIIAWFVYAAIAASLTAPIVFLGRKRIFWETWEFLALVIPYFVWLGLMLSDFKPKSLSNLVEPILIGFAVPVLALLRVSLSRKMDERLLAAGLITILSLVAVAVYWVVPCLPE